MRNTKLVLGFIYFLLVNAVSIAQPQTVRWTGIEDKNSNLVHILDVIKSKTGIELSAADFMLVESRKLATSHYLMLAQTSGGLPLRGLSLRVWTSLANSETIQVEARIDATPNASGWSAKAARAAISSTETMEIVRAALKNTDDPFIRKIKWQDMWEKGQVVRVVKVNGKRGKSTIVIGLVSKKVIAQSYEEFPQADLASKGDFSIPVRVYPIYEVAEGDDVNPTLLPRISSELKYLNRKIHVSTGGDPLAALKKQHYLDNMFDPLKGLTLEGREKGYWAMAYIKDQAEQLISALPTLDNSFENGGVFLEGKYATVSLYPEAAKFPKINFTPFLSAHFRPEFVPMADNSEHEEMIPATAIYGRPLSYPEEAWNRIAQKLPDNDPAAYLNDGFDEIQVYWAVTQMFESLRASGFTDPELSTRPFHAFLYNPDISYRDNAFYTDDTINFTTYSAKSPNMARDNTTIWHELGHGVMDRMMGDHIELADTGGLSEGMADFVAQLVVNDVTGGTDFPGKYAMRIFNNTGYYLTNEVHDDGEAYGGSMNDILQSAMAKYGREGLKKITDLTMETMRLTRNHPELTAVDWFQHMLFADELGRKGVRGPGELKEMIIKALNGRNFNMDGSASALLTVKNGSSEVTSSGPGSRINPIKVSLNEQKSAEFNLDISVKNSATYKFKFPVTVKVNYSGGALEGGVHWLNEEAGNLTYVLNSDSDVAKFTVGTDGKCDEVNRPDGSCVDYVYVQIWNQGENNKPQAKKRFYLRVFPEAK
jgi:hypothetical protein